MPPFFIPAGVKIKIVEKHHLTVEEVREAFFNLEGEFATEEREANQGSHKRYWFISKSDTGRVIKVVLADEDGSFYLVTAYEPDDQEVNLYENL